MPTTAEHESETAEPETAGASPAPIMTPAAIDKLILEEQTKIVVIQTRIRRLRRLKKNAAAYYDGAGELDDAE